MNPNFKFSCGTLDTINGYKLKASTPDENGFYTQPIGCLGAPTRAGVIYDPDSTIAAMNDPKSKFNISLKEGYLFGEWDHPFITNPRDPEQLARLYLIKGDCLSHVFNRIWIDNEVPVNMDNGEQGYRIMAKVKPFGPHGAWVEQSLRDPLINTSFSIRCMCLPMSGPRKECEYRKVCNIITFDAVPAPGFAIANKRYGTNPGMEHWNECDIDLNDVYQALDKLAVGMESSIMVDKQEIRRMQRDIERHHNEMTIDSIHLGGRTSLMNQNGEYFNAANLMYGDRR